MRKLLEDGRDVPERIKLMVRRGSLGGGSLEDGALSLFTTR